MRSIRWKLVLMSMALVFIPVYLLNRYAIVFFDRFTRAELETHLRHTAFLVGEQYRQGVLANTAEPAADAAARFAAHVAAVGREIEARVQVLDTDGRVRFDSAGPAGESLADRPEVREALEGRYSARSRLTPDRRLMYYYIARAVKAGDRRTVLGVVCVTRHTAPIVAAIQRMVANQRLATQIALGLAAMGAGVLAYTLTRRLRALTRAAGAYAAGEATFDMRPRGGDEIADLARAVRHMAAEIEARNRYNRDFISTTLHEFKTPLTAIAGSVELLQQGAADKPDARARFLANIRHQAERMVRMTGELQELTRLDVEMLRGRRERVEYGAFVREVLERLEPTFDAVHAALQVELPSAPVHVWVAPHRIEQVLSNLLDNAFRYTPASGTVRVCVSVDAAGGVTTAVSDTGVGIAPENLGRVFDRFFTTEPKDRPRDYGSGLGLAIARAIVENHRGQIRVESPWPPPGRPPEAARDSGAGPGTCFLFTLPTA